MRRISNLSAKRQHLMVLFFIWRKMRCCKGDLIVDIFKIRDFIYLDIERLKSIIAQVEQGLVDQLNEVKGNIKEAATNVEGSLFGFVKGVGGGKFVWQNQATETKSLHDYIYNKVESSLIENDVLIILPGKHKNLSNNELRELFTDSSFILTNGKVNINDFTQMRMMLDRFNDMGKFIAQCNVMSSVPDNTSKHLRKDILKKATDEMTMDKSMIDGFKLIFDIFYKERIVIKMIPFDNCPDFRLVGNLNKQYLRDDIESIIYKYGTAPVANWTIFGQIASIPPKDRREAEINMSGSEIEVALHKMFNAFRGVEAIAQSVDYPEIAITPIAIYRE